MEQYQFDMLFQQMVRQTDLLEEIATNLKTLVSGPPKPADLPEHAR